MGGGVVSGSSPAAGSLRSALRHRGFGRFLTATIVSSAGDFLNSVAVVVVIYRATGSAGWLGAAVFLRVVAWAVATAAGGVVGDRFDRRKVLVSLNIAAGIVALVLAVAASFDAARRRGDRAGDGARLRDGAGEPDLLGGRSGGGRRGRRRRGERRGEHGGAGQHGGRPGARCTPDRGVLTGARLRLQCPVVRRGGGDVRRGGRRRERGRPGGSAAPLP